MRTLIATLFAVLSVLCVSAENRALLVGIGRYPSATGWPEIHGDADVSLLAPVLKSKGYIDVTVLKNAQATKCAIVRALKALASRCHPGDKVYFHFSGHGQHVTDINGDERGKDYDESIVPYDAYKSINCRVGGRFYNGENHLVDDELNPLFAAIKQNLGPDGEFFIAIDACYSDNMERAPGADEAAAAPTRGTDERLNVKPTPRWTDMPRPKPFCVGAKMYVVSACRSDERNFEYIDADGKLYGSLSYFIYRLTDSTMGFNTWAGRIVSKKPAYLNIFHSQQHPQKRVYK